MRRLYFGAFGIAVLLFVGAPIGAQAPVQGVCGRLPLPPELRGKKVVLAIPANKAEAKPCAPGTVVAYTLVDGQQVFLPVAADGVVIAQAASVTPAPLATDLSGLATAPAHDDPFTLELAKAWDIGAAELLAEDRRKAVLKAARIDERRDEISAAATAGDAAAQWLIGLDLIDRATASFEYRTAAFRLEQSAKQGFAPAQYHLAMLYYQAQGVRFDKNKLIGLLAAASAAGDVHAQRVAASLQQSGAAYVTQDTDAAMAVEARLAERGFVPAVVNRLVRGMSATTSTASIVELKRLSNDGSSSAASMLSRAYLYGWNVPKDKALAVSYAELAASRGFVGALDTAADHYRSAKGAEKDKDLAAKLDAQYFTLILSSAQKGHAIDQVSVADAYVTGHGVSRDNAAWRTWMERAQAAGLPQARKAVAEAKNWGMVGYARDCPTAARELTALSREGYYSADLIIGSDYVMGHCNNKDLYMARQHFERANRLGNSSDRAAAQGHLNYIRGQGLSPKQGGGGFLDVIAQAAPVLIGALNDATADIAAQRQAEAAQQARSSEQYQAAMAAAQARQRQAGAEGAALAAERDARNATSEQARQDALKRQQAALAQARAAAATTARPAEQTPTRTTTITGATTQRAAGGSATRSSIAGFGSQTGAGAALYYYPETLVYCYDIRAGSVDCRWEGGEIDGFNDTRFASDRDFLASIVRYCAGRPSGSSIAGAGMPERIYRCGVGGWTSFQPEQSQAMRDVKHFNMRSVFRCPPGLRRCSTEN